MKKLTLLLLALFSFCGARAAEDFTGKVVTLSKATSISPGQWYALYNTSSKVFIFDDGSGTLTTSSTPATTLASESAGNLMMLESAGDGTYYVKTGLDNYLGEVTSNTLRTSANASAAYTFANVDGDEGSWSIANSGKYLNGSLKGVSTLNTQTTWTIYEVTLSSESELSASNRMLYQEKLFKSDNRCLARFFSKRNTARYLTSNTKGAASGAALKSKTELSQIWLITYDGSSGYTFLNAETGQYLSSTFSAPSGSSTTMYIQRSPNNSDEKTDYYFNISTSSSFSGQTCLNLGNDGSTLYEWSCGDGDTGSDWAAEIVYELTVDDVIGNIQSSNEYASELKNGSYYRIINDSYGVCMTEANNQLKCQNADESNFAQYWQLIKNGSKWYIKNVMTDNYVQSQNAFYTAYTTGTTPVSFTISSTGDDLANTWYIYNANSNSTVLHCDASYTVVNWYTGNVASMWDFLEVELSEEDIAAAKDEFSEYTDIVENLSSIQASLDRLFQDKACTTLLDDIAALSDEELELNADYASLPTGIKEMVLKVKNDTWGLAATNTETTDSYERFFRIADYRPYSHYSTMSGNSYTGQSYAYGKLSGPTGIYINNGDLLYIYVDESPNKDCTLQVEIVNTDGVPGDHQTGATTDLTAGLNVLRGAEQDVVYIFYQLNDPAKYLADYPDIKIHIEGGTLNGYWDATRDMTNQDWANMKDLGLLSKCSVINLKTENLVFAMDSELVLSAMSAAHKSAKDKQEDIELLMRIWDMIPANEQSYQGLEDMDGRFRNVWNCFSVNYNYMFATTYGTYYENSTLATIMNYYQFTHQSEGNEGGAIWGPSHEMGHNHQNAINLIGTTESSNNLFSNINMYEQGVSTTRGPSPVTNFDDYLANGTTWLGHDIWITTRMFFQLYLYFHVMEHDTLFVPNLFKALRKDPISKNGSNSKGKDDYLHFAEKVCEVANADLSEFFEAYGMFVPVDNYYVDDYSTYYVTTSQSDIDSSKKTMQKYEKKLGNIMFIDDHIVKHLADPDNKFEAVPASDGYKVNCATGTNYKVGTAGDVGDYEEYDGHTEYIVNSDYYTMSSTGSVTFKGSGFVGHKVYDLDGNLLWATNKTTVTVPSAIRSLFPYDVVVVAAEANMEDVPCPYYKQGGTDPVYRVNVSFPDGTSTLWWANDNIDAYLPENAIGVIGSTDAPETLTSSVNVINTDSTAQSIVINGDMECHIPQEFTAQSLQFTKSGDGYQALCLPFAVSDTTTIIDGGYLYNADVAAGEPVVVEGDIDFSLEDVTLTAGDFTPAESGYVLSSDGSEVVAAEDITPFVYLFDTAFELGIYDAINEMLSSPNADENSVYDLSGRRLTKVTKPGIYIVNGVKTFVR